jgi:hypothetical protein
MSSRQDLGMRLGSPRISARGERRMQISNTPYDMHRLRLYKRFQFSNASVAAALPNEELLPDPERCGYG